MPYKPVKLLLCVLLGGAICFAALSGPSTPAAILVVVAAALFVVWLASHPNEVREAHLARVSKGSQFIRESTQPWKAPTNQYVITGLLLIAGGVLVSAAFSNVSSPRGYLRQLLFSVIGHTGTVVLGAFFGAYLLCLAVEQFLAVQWSKKA